MRVARAEGDRPPPTPGYNLPQPSPETGSNSDRVFNIVYCVFRVFVLFPMFPLFLCYFIFVVCLAVLLYLCRFCYFQNRNQVGACYSLIETISKPYSNPKARFKPDSNSIKTHAGLLGDCSKPFPSRSVLFPKAVRVEL